MLVDLSFYFSGTDSRRGTGKNSGFVSWINVARSLLKEQWQHMYADKGGRLLPSLSPTRTLILFNTHGPKDSSLHGYVKISQKRERIYQFLQVIHIFRVTLGSQVSSFKKHFHHYVLRLLVHVGYWSPHFTDIAISSSFFFFKHLTGVCMIFKSLIFKLSVLLKTYIVQSNYMARF